VKFKQLASFASRKMQNILFFLKKKGAVCKEKQNYAFTKGNKLTKNKI
jgi:hypothetical protein